MTTANTETDRATEAPASVASTGGFASLYAAKKAGWYVSIRNAGPSDWVHYSAYVQHPKYGDAFMVDDDANWMRKDAQAQALARINRMVANK